MPIKIVGFGLIAGIVAIICVNNGNIGGAIVALAVGAILHDIFS